MKRGLAVAAAVATLFGFPGEARSALVADAPELANHAAASRGYLGMSEDERNDYVARRARAISASLTGGRPLAPTPEAVRMIKRELDAYASRIDSPGDRASLSTVVARGAKAAPTINREFRRASVPVVAGLYIAMIESEFGDCPTAPSGARGMFQFLPATAKRYGVAESKLCDLRASARAAAAYLADQRKALGGGSLESALAVLSYNLGIKRVKSEIAPLTDASRDDSLWTALASLDEAERSRYLPMFFAAAIVGESPVDFGIDGAALSSY